MRLKLADQTTVRCTISIVCPNCGTRNFTVFSNPDKIDDRINKMRCYKCTTLFYLYEEEYDTPPQLFLEGVSAQQAISDLEPSGE